MLYGVGSENCIGAIWTAPTLHMSQLCTSPTERLNFDCPSALARLLKPESLQRRVLAAATQSQMLHSALVGASVENNQVCFEPIAIISGSGCAQTHSECS
jgi:hypothetical protein